MTTSEQRRRQRRRASLVLACGCLGLAGQAAWARASADLADLSLEQLGELRVTSVTGREEPLQDAAASIFVITAEDIRRSAATSLAEALRLAPNLQVARLNATQWAVSARGFNNAIGNKLLVLVDGRVVYSPLFAGVFWDAQDVMLEDVERIEVISGPGGALWGANAVNGVINVVTRAAQDTQGTLLQATGSRSANQAVARFGGRFGSDGQFRVYAMRLQHDNTVRQDGMERDDATSKLQAGFRADWSQGASAGLTVQGDVYRAGDDGRSNLSPLLHGGNLLVRWTQRAGSGDWHLQAYVDEERRDDRQLFQIRTRTTDLQFDHAFAPTANQKLIWGAGYRSARSEADRTAFVLFDPAVRQLSWAHLFVQDELRLTEPLRLTGGLKLEHNVYTGTEVLPTLRASYRLGATDLLWAAWSRSLRAPARVDRDFRFPASPPFLLQGGPDFESEVARVTELGWRHDGELGGGEVTLFHQAYEGLRGGRIAPTPIENRIDGAVDGLEAWAHLNPHPQWRLSAGWLELRKSLHALPGTAANSIADLGNDPRQQWQLRAAFDAGGGLQVDVSVRHVGALPQPAVQAYTATELRVAYQPTGDFTASLLLQNAFDPRHIEFNAVSTASEIPRNAMLRLTWTL